MTEPSNNFGHPILEATAYGWSSDPKPIRHYILTVAQEVGGKLNFQAFPKSKDVDHATDADDMGRYAAGKIGTPVGGRGVVPSPLDMSIRYQGWLLIQLDPAINWQFTKGEVPCTLKEQDLTGRNIKLRHVYDDGRWSNGPVVADDCRTIFMGVVKRAKPTGPGEPPEASCFINLNVEFLQEVNGRPTRLKIIIDPDVPNEGPDSIP